MRENNIMFSEYGKALIYLYENSDDNNEVKYNVSGLSNAFVCSINRVAQIIDTLEKRNYIELKDEIIKVTQIGEKTAIDLIGCYY